MRRLFAVASTLLLIVGTSDEAAIRTHTPPPGSPLANHEHPRIWISKAVLPALRAKLAGPFKSEYSDFVSELELSGPSRVGGERRKPGKERSGATAARPGSKGDDPRSKREEPRSKSDEPGSKKRTRDTATSEPSGEEEVASRRGRKAQRLEQSEADILNYAFVYRIGPVPGVGYGHSAEEYGARAKALLLKTIDQAGPSKTSYWPDVAYDWLYDLLTPEERLKVWTYLEALDSKQNSVKDPWDDRSSRTVTRRVLAGLAFWGDGIDDAAAARLVDLYYSQVLNGGMLEAANFIAADAGGVSEGFSYAARGGESSTIENLLKLLEGWRTANGLSRSDVFGGSHATALRYFPQWVAYLIRPYAAANPGLPGGHEYYPYKTHNMDAANPIGAKGTLRAIFASLRLYKDIDPQAAALAEWLAEDRVGTVALSGAEGREKALLSHFVFGEKGIDRRSPAQLGLPLTKKFDGLGWVVMRTGWEKLSESMVTFMATSWRRSGYTNSNQNSFTIDRRGPLALNSGYRTHQAYANATWSSNTIIFVDPAGPPDSAEGFDFGGQRRAFKPIVTSSLMLKPGSMYDLGGVKRFQAANPAESLDFDYVFGDATRAYNGPTNHDVKNTPKVALFTRQFVYFRPATSGDSDRIVVFDRAIATEARYEKRWLLHTSGNPKVDGVETADREGRWTYRDAGLVTATNTAAGSSGRLFSRTLLPADRRIVKIGGPGHEFEDPYGTNDPTKGFDPDDDKAAQYVGTYRIEVIPSASNASDLFLHVLEATDAGSAAPTPSALLEGHGLVGARVGQRIAAFNRTEEAVTEGDLLIDRAGTYRVLLCDLKPGVEYQVQYAGKTAGAMATSAGLAYLDLTVPSATRLAVRPVSAPTSQPAARARPGTRVP